MNANGRRQRQAANGFAHLPVRKRPNYKRRDIQASIAHENRIRATEQRIKQGSKKK